MSALHLLPDEAVDLGARDAALPALPLALADAPLRAWLADRGHHLVHRNYLRYKPGTSCVVGLLLASGPAWLSIVSEASAVKQEKVVRQARPEDILVHDTSARVLMARLPADRHLPAVHHLRRTLRRLADQRIVPAGTEAGSLHTLVHKPHRRWVGWSEAADESTVLLRAYQAGRLRGALAGLAVAPIDIPRLRTPRVLGTLSRDALVALEFLPGTPLQQLIASERASTDDLVRVGSALAALHQQPIGGVADGRPAPTTPTADLVAQLLPEQGERVRELDRWLSTWTSSSVRTRCHGDFSADQVVLQPGNPDAPVGLIDWDRAGVDDPAADLAHAWAAGLGETHRAALLEGYTRTRDLPPVGMQLARAWLLRAADPLRTAAHDWPDRIVEHLDRAEEALGRTDWSGR